MPADAPMGLPELAALVVGGLACIAGGLAAFYGRPRGSKRIAQRQSYIIWHQVRAGTAIGARHIYPALLPTGIAILLVVLASLLMGAGERWELLGILVFLLALVVLALALLMAFRPPRRFLPTWWIVEEERRRAGLEPLISPPSQGRDPMMTRKERRLAFLLLIGFVVVGIVLRVPAPLVLAGLSPALVYLAVVRVRDKHGDLPSSS